MLTPALGGLLLNNNRKGLRDLIQKICEEESLMPNEFEGVWIASAPSALRNDDPTSRHCEERSDAPTRQRLRRGESNPDKAFSIVMSINYKKISFHVVLSAVSFG